MSGKFDMSPNRLVSQKVEFTIGHDLPLLTEKIMCGSFQKWSVLSFSSDKVFQAKVIAL